MIVKCEQCQTRFKIPDDRVTDKGVKVRCTKCQHTFRVTRDMAQSTVTAAPVPAPSRPPPPAIRPPTVAPAAEADPFARFGGASDASAHEETRPGVFALGVEASKSPAFSLPPPEPIRSAPASAKPFDFTSLAPSAPVSAPRPAPRASAPPPPAAVAAPPPPARQSAPFDFAGLVAAPSPPSPKMSPPGPSPFDFSALGPVSAATEPSAGLAFDFGTLGPATASAPPPPGAGRPAPPAFDFSALGPPPPPASTAATTKLAAFEPSFGQQPVLEHSQPPPPAPPAPLFADVPDLNEPSAAASTMRPPNVPDDFFGTPLSPPPSAPGAGGGYRTGASKEELFDMPLAAPAPEAPMEAIQLSGPDPISKISAPRTTGQVETPSQRGKRRGALGLVVNLGIAVVLVAGLVIVGSALLNDGKIDASIFSASRLKALVTRDSDFEASDISNGLYDTQRGKPVFFVRGEVTNHSATATRVRIRAEILDGQSMVRAAEVVAGTPPTPEQLRNLTGADEVERLLTAVSKTAPSLAPGQSAPFLVTFFEYPPDLKAFRVRVSARAEGSETAER